MSVELLVRDIGARGNEVMLDVGDGNFVTVCVVGMTAIILPPEGERAKDLLRGAKVRKKIVEFLGYEYSFYLATPLEGR